MTPWPRSRALLTLALLLAWAALPHPPSAAAEATAQEKVLASVNGEAITESDLESASRTAASGSSRQSILKGLIEEALLVQEAQRTKTEESHRYRHLERGWRRNYAIGLIGVDILRRSVAAAGGPEENFADFFPRWQEVYASLTADERARVDHTVEAHLEKLRNEARAPIDTKALEQYAHMAEIPPETARQVMVMRTSRVSVTLEEVLASEPTSLGHVGQTPMDVITMWQQIANQIAGRELILLNAEAAGLFEIEGVKREQEKVRRTLLRRAFLEQVYAEKITADVIRKSIEENVAALSRDFEIGAELVTLAGAQRMTADAVLSGWKEGAPLPSGVEVERLTLEQAWARLTGDHRRVAARLQWEVFAPPLRSGDGYLLLRLVARKPPPGGSLGAVAGNRVRSAVFRELIGNLSEEARIEVY